MKIRAAVSPIVNQMKTRTVFFASTFAAALGIMLVTPAASAQKSASQATIPFAFEVNHKELPAGHYRVVMDSENSLRLVNWETGDSAGIVVHTTRSVKNSPGNNLVFLRDEQGYELTMVRFGQGAVQTEVVLQSKLDRETAKGAKFKGIGVSTR